MLMLDSAVVVTAYCQELLTESIKVIVFAAIFVEIDRNHKAI